MRCKNCGWPNKPSETNCVKCGSPLSKESAPDNFGGNENRGYVEESVNKTVLENDVFGYADRQQPAQHQYNEHRPAEPAASQCKKCGYPLRPGIDKCPNCNFQLRTSTVPENREESHPHADYVPGNSRQPTKMDSASKADRPLRGTINPYMMNLDAEPTFILKPVKRIDERHEFNEQEYEGSEVLLNRDNTEPGNPSITSREQAVIYHADGKWYIEDKSEQKTTFVQAANKIELHDGDLILLGNRLFEFKK